MSGRGVARALTIARRSFLDTARKPSWWLLVALLALLGGTLTASGGWLMLPSRTPVPPNSASALLAANALITMVLTVPTATLVFGLRIARDRTLGMTRLLAATGLRPVEHLAGHVIAAAGLVSIMLAAIFVLGIVLTERDAQWISDSAVLPLGNYVVAAITMLWLPTFAAGAFSAAVAAASGRASAVVFSWIPLLSVSLVAEWRPAWMPGWVDRLLTGADITGLRWLESELFAVNRGSAYFGAASMETLLSEGGGSLVVSRFVVAALAIASLGMAALSLSRAARPRHRIAPSAVATALAAKPVGRDAAAPDVTAFAAVAGRHSAIAAGWSLGWSDALAVVTRPGLWCWLLITGLVCVSLMVEGSEGVVGEVQLASSAKFVSECHSVYLFMALVLTASAVIGLSDRGEAARRDALVTQMPIPTAAIVLGRMAACLVPAMLLYLSVLPAVAIAHALQGNSDPVVQSMNPWPVIASWAILALPSTMLFASALMLVHALFPSKGLVLAAGGGLLAIAILPLIVLQSTAPWWCEWAMVLALPWSDLSPLEPDRTALLTNRAMVLAISWALAAVAIRIWPRERLDLTRSPGPLVRLGRAARSPAAATALAIAVACSLTNWFRSSSGPEGYWQRSRVQQYVGENLLTWLNAPQPRLRSVRLRVFLDPANDQFRCNATMALENGHPFGLRSFALTVSPTWQVDSISCVDQSKDLLIEPTGLSGMLYRASAIGGRDALGPGETCSIQFEYSGSCMGGIGMAPRPRDTFMVEGGVLMTSQTLDFLPLVGFVPELIESHELEPDRLEAGRGGAPRKPFSGGGGFVDVEAEVTVPEAYRANLPGILTAESVANGLRTLHWKTDRPVSDLFHIVAGKWVESKGARSSIWHSPLHGANVPSMLEALDGARDRYSRWFGDYPWRDLRISEFPGLSDYAQSGEGNIVFSESMGFRALRTKDVDAAFIVTAHEAAHQWWGGMVLPGAGPGGNILSEGLAQYSAIRLVGEIRGPRMQQAFLGELETLYLKNRDPASEQPLSEFDDGSADSYTLLYHRGGWVFWMLANRIGLDASDAAHREFVAHYADRHAFPVLEDYLAFMSRHAPSASIADFASQWIDEVGIGHYSVEVLSCERREDRWRTMIRVSNLGDCTEAVDVAITNGEPRWPDGPGGVSGYLSEVGRVAFDGANSKELTIETPFEPREAVVDPDFKVLQIGRAAAVARISVAATR